MAKEHTRSTARCAPQHLAIIIATGFSGSAALVYQVVWIRKFLYVTTALEQSQALVIALFMAGLALGAYVAAGWVSRIRRPLVGYAIIESIAALLALAAMEVMEASHAWRSGLIGLGLSSATALWLQMTFLALFLLIPTTLMGASIPVILAAVERLPHFASHQRRAVMASLIYGFNTLGAIGGCLLAGYVLIEQVGLWRAAWVGAGFALVAALLALLCALSGKATPTDRPVVCSTLPAAPSSPRRLPPPNLVAIAFLAGFIGLAAELVWTRMIALVVLNTVYAYTLVIAAVLFGIAWGGFVAAWLVKRYGNRPSSLRQSMGYIGALALTLVTLSGCAIVQLADNPAFALAAASGVTFKTVGIALMILAPPSAAVATLLPLTVALTERLNVSAAFGILYGFNTLGGVLGSLLAGFVLLPYAGLDVALSVLLVIIGGICWLAVPLRRQAALLRLGLGASAVGAVMLSVSMDLPQQIYDARIPPDTIVLDFFQGSESDVLVTQNQRGHRRLWINSAWVAGTGGGHLSLGHLPAIVAGNPKKALGIAIGTGQTFAAAIKHGIAQLTCVDINAGVIHMAKRWFKPFNQALFERHNVEVVHQDGRAFMRVTNQHYDLIILEPLQAWTAGTTGLYSKEFYLEAQHILNKGGVLAQWIPFYGQALHETKSMVRTALAVFPEASLWLDDRDALLIMTHGPWHLDPAAMHRAAANPAIAADLAQRNLQRPADLLSLMVLGPKALTAWSADGTIIHDDRPFLEFAAARFIGKSSYLETVDALRRHLSPIATANPQGRYTHMQPEATNIRQARLASSALPESSFMQRATLLRQGMRQAPHSLILQSTYRNLVLDWAEATAKAGADTATVAAIYRQGIAAHPGFGEAMVNLALLHAEQQQFQQSRQWLLKALKVKRVKNRATQILELVEKR